MTMINPDPPESTPPTPDTTDADADAFAEEWVDYKHRVDSLTDILDSLFGKDEMNEQPPEQQPSQQSTASRTPKKGGAPAGAPGGIGNTPAEKTPDTPPEESHWYYKSRTPRPDWLKRILGGK